MITEVISTILQVMVFTLIPFVVYLITNKSSRGFFQYIGFTPSNTKASGLAVLVAIVFIVGGVGLALLNDSIREILFDPQSVSGKLREIGFSGQSVFLLLITAGIKTSLSEEILFRGFIGKRLIHRLGFRKGNLLQAIIFGLVHVLLFYFTMDAQIVFLIYIFTLSGVAGWACGYLNEKMAGGSILPGWIAHGLGNVLSYTLIAFVL